MATTLQSDISSSLRWTFQTTDGADARTTTDANSISLIDSLVDGNGLDQANLIIHARATVPVATPLSVDLAGTLKDSFGNTITMTKVKAIGIAIPYLAGGGDLTVGGTFTSYLGGTTPTLFIKNGGGVFLWNPTAAGYAVTAGTGDTLTLTATTATVVADYVVIGAT